MKNLTYLLFLLVSIIALSACEKEEKTALEVTQAHFVGKWLLKTHIEKVIKNGAVTQNDTITLSPVDTLTYTIDGKYTRADVTVGYSFDANGENISYATTPASTIWKINFLRSRSIILSQQKTLLIGADTFVYYTEDQLSK